MAVTGWEPATEAEAALRDALRANDQQRYFRILARTDLLLPVPEPALGQASGWGTWTTSGRTHVLAFTSAAAMRACLGEHAGASRLTSYPDLASGWPNHEWWLAVNPGLPIEGYLPAWYVAQLSRGDVRLPGRTMGARARLERAETVARARAAGAGNPPSGPPTPAARPPAAEQVAPSRPEPPTVPLPPRVATPAGPVGPARDRRSVEALRPSVPPPYPADPARSERPDLGWITRPVPPAFPHSGTGDPAAPARPGVPPAEPVAEPGRPPANGRSTGDAPARTAPRSFFEPASGRGSAYRDDPVRPADRAVPPSRFARGSQPFPRRRPAGDPVPDGPTEAFPTTQPYAPPSRPDPARGSAQWPPPPEEVTRAIPVPTERGYPGPPPDEETTQALPRRRPAPAPADPADDLPPSAAEPVSGPPAPRRGFTPIVIEGTIVESRDLTEPLDAGPPVSAGPGPFGPDDSGPPVPNSSSAAPAGGPASAGFGSGGSAGAGPASSGESAGAGFGSPAAGPAAPPSAGAAAPPVWSARPAGTGVPGPERVAERPGSTGEAGLGPAGAEPLPGVPSVRSPGGQAGGDEPEAASPAPADRRSTGWLPSQPVSADPQPAGNIPTRSPSDAATADRRTAGWLPNQGDPQAAGTMPAGPAAGSVATAGQQSAGWAANEAFDAEAVGTLPASEPLSGSGVSPDQPGASDRPGAGWIPDQPAPAEHSAWTPARTGDGTPQAGAAPEVAPAAGSAAENASDLADTGPLWTVPDPVVTPPAAGTPATEQGSDPARANHTGAPTAGPTTDAPTAGPGTDAWTTGPEADAPTAGSGTDPRDAGTGGTGPAAEPPPTRAAEPPSAPAAEFQPANPVEEDLLDAAGAGSTDTFLSTLLLARVLLPVSAESAPGSRPGEPGFVWRTEELDGETFVVVYTSPERLADHTDAPVETVRVRFVQLIRRWPDEAWSFAVNPGTPVGAKLPGEQIVGLANWAAEVGLGDDADNEPEAPTAPEVAERPRYTPPAVDPARPVVMQKAVAPSQLGYYLERGYDRVSGFVHRASELAHLTTPAQLYEALGLDYPDSPFARNAEEIYVLRWPAYRPSLYRIPYGGQNEAAMRAMEGWVIERGPFRGNGFAPGESSDVVAEFKVDSARLPHGAQLWRIGADGTERMVAVLDTDALLWRQVDAP
ncbi:SseB protein N-terminal domain-containing protein [Micromonospora echinaurantiaca]|uniref:SseB protein N-terminal domain-containing protein n=1 Tax=Micromonospora echinaurantiaca TaxID=47857 RepID=A0A1C5KBD9_9ACTN|nr:SseB protein N-terminal domain-containing protein [Micromonospora echinaurantiaca]